MDAGFSGCTSRGQLRFSAESQHSSTPLTPSNLLLDTFQNKKYLIVGPIFVLLSLSLSFYWSFFSFFSPSCVRLHVHVYVREGSCVCLSVYGCACVWLVISLLLWSVWHFNKCFYIYHAIRPNFLAISLPATFSSFHPSLSLFYFSTAPSAPCCFFKLVVFLSSLYRLLPPWNYASEACHWHQGLAGPKS